MAADDPIFASPQKVCSFMPCELLWSSPETRSDRLYVYWSQYNNELKRLQDRFSDICIERSSENAKIGKKIKRVLLSLSTYRFIFSSYLVQFWAPVSIGNKNYLTTADQPFGLNKLHKQLCSYRRDSMDLLLPVENVYLSPPARVFRNGLPEFSLDVSDYLNEEYPLRDRAVQCGVEIYIAAPLFRSYSDQCIGVLEIVSTPARDPFYFKNDLFETYIKHVDLRTPCTDTDTHISEETVLELGKVMSVVSEMHKLPIAQTWIACRDARFAKKVCGYSCIKLMLDDEFVYSGRICQIQNGVIGKAFSSQNACFCVDVSRLSISEYPYVTNARTLELSACFAICLKSTLTPDLIYTLELFLPSHRIPEGDPKSFLDAILLTIKENFKSFKLAFGQEAGEMLFVEVIKVSPNDELESFEIGGTSSPPSPTPLSSFADSPETIEYMLFDSQPPQIDGQNTSQQQNGATHYESSETLDIFDSLFDSPNIFDPLFDSQPPQIDEQNTPQQQNEATHDESSERVEVIFDSHYIFDSQSPQIDEQNTSQQQNGATHDESSERVEYIFDSLFDSQSPQIDEQNTSQQQNGATHYESSSDVLRARIAAGGTLPGNAIAPISDTPLVQPLTQEVGLEPRQLSLGSWNGNQNNSLVRSNSPSLHQEPTLGLQLGFRFGSELNSPFLGQGMSPDIHVKRRHQPEDDSESACSVRNYSAIKRRSISPSISKPCDSDDSDFSDINAFAQIMRGENFQFDKSDG